MQSAVLFVGPFFFERLSPLLSLQCKKNCNAKKTAQSLGCSRLSFLWALFFSSGCPHSFHCNAKKTAMQKKLPRVSDAVGCPFCGPFFFRAAVPTPFTAMQKKLQCKKNCNAKKTAMQKK